MLSQFTSDSSRYTQIVDPLRKYSQQFVSVDDFDEFGADRTPGHRLAVIELRLLAGPPALGTQDRIRSGHGSASGDCTPSYIKSAAGSASPSLVSPRLSPGINAAQPVHTTTMCVHDTSDGPSDRARSEFNRSYCERPGSAGGTGV